MNREIKFRAWDKVTRKMEEFDLNSLYWRGEDSGAYDFPGEESLVMQFTGLKDKNGKEIYEGDIVKGDDGDIREVYFVERFVDGSSNRHYSGYFWGMNNPVKSEVIGNIYETPELLKHE